MTIMGKPKYARRYNTCSLVNDRGAWRIKYYPYPGSTQRTHTLGKAEGKNKISKSEAEALKADFVAKLNSDPQDAKQMVTVSEFVTSIYASNQREAFRKGSVDNALDEIRRWIIPSLGNRKFTNLSAEDLDAVLFMLKERGESKRTIDRTRFYLAAICKLAISRGLLTTPIHVGLPKVRSKKKPCRQKSNVDCGIRSSLDTSE